MASAVPCWESGHHRPWPGERGRWIAPSANFHCAGLHTQECGVLGVGEVKDICRSGAAFATDCCDDMLLLLLLPLLPRPPPATTSTRSWSMKAAQSWLLSRSRSCWLYDDSLCFTSWLMHDEQPMSYVNATIPQDQIQTLTAVPPSPMRLKTLSPKTPTPTSTSDGAKPVPVASAGKAVVERLLH